MRRDRACTLSDRRRTGRHRSRAARRCADGHSRPSARACRVAKTKPRCSYDAFAQPYQLSLFGKVSGVTISILPAWIRCSYQSAAWLDEATTTRRTFSSSASWKTRYAISTLARSAAYAEPGVRRVARCEPDIAASGARLKARCMIASCPRKKGRRVSGSSSSRLATCAPSTGVPSPRVARTSISVRSYRSRRAGSIRLATYPVAPVTSTFRWAI